MANPFQRFRMDRLYGRSPADVSNLFLPRGEDRLYNQERALDILHKKLATNQPPPPMAGPGLQRIVPPSNQQPMNVQFADLQDRITPKEKAELELEREKLNLQAKTSEGQLEVESRKTDIQSKLAEVEEWKIKNPELQIVIPKSGNVYAVNKRTGDKIDTGIDTGGLSDAEQLSREQQNRLAQITATGEQSRATADVTAGHRSELEDKQQENRLELEDKRIEGRVELAEVSQSNREIIERMRQAGRSDQEILRQLGRIELEEFRQEGRTNLEDQRTINRTTIEAMKQAGRSDLEILQQLGRLELEETRQTGRTELEGTRQAGRKSLAEASRAAKDIENRTRHRERLKEIEARNGRLTDEETPLNERRRIANQAQQFILQNPDLAHWVNINRQGFVDVKKPSSGFFGTNFGKRTPDEYANIINSILDGVEGGRMIKVISPDGVSGSIPESDLDAAIGSGYQVVP